ncbi:MAG TPA: YidB family protein [Edaphobacter sp.]
MGILDKLQSLAGQAGDESHSDTAKVAGGFVQALTNHPDGIQGILSSLNANGMAQHVSDWAKGIGTTATPEQVQQGLGSSGFLNTIAQHAGVSPAVASTALATILPMAIQHFAPGGQAAQTSSLGGLAEQFLSKLKGGAPN